MPFNFLKHTADTRMKVSAGSLSGLFSEALLGVMAMLQAKCAEKKTEVQHTVNVKSIDSTSLLVDFLNEAISLAYINKEVYNKANITKLNTSSLKAILIGQKTDYFESEIKAVTYYNAKISKNIDGIYKVTLTFDI